MWGMNVDGQGDGEQVATAIGRLPSHLKPTKKERPATSSQGFRIPGGSGTANVVCSGCRSHPSLNSQR
jgi:hypothetical protein